MNIDSTRKGERQISLRSLFTAMLLMVVALAAILGFTSTKTFAAENNSSIVPDNASEVVLTSSATGDVDQPVTDADYAKLNAQYKVTPDGTPTIQSKTQNVETLTTKDGNKDKSYTKTTTKWVISDEDKTPATKPASQENPGSKTNVGPIIFAPINLRSSVPALLGGAVLGAVPALAAVPAAFLAGGVLPTAGALAAVPAAFVAGQAAKALPAALTGAALAAKPAFDAGKLAAAVPAVLAAKPVFDAGKLAATVPALLTVKPIFDAGKLAAAIPAVLAVKPLFDAGKLAGLALATVPAKLALQNLGAIHALNDPLFNIGGPILRAVKGFFNPIPEIVKDHLEDLALARLPLQVVGALHAITNPLSFGVKGFLFPVTEIAKHHLVDAFRHGLELGALANAGLVLKGLNDLARLALIGRLPLALLGVAHAFANPLSIGGPIWKTIKGLAFPLIEIVKDHLEDLALARLPLQVVGALHAITNPLSFGVKGFLFPVTEIAKHHLVDAFRHGLELGALANAGLVLKGLNDLARLALIGRLPLALLGVAHAFANPLSIGGPIWKTFKGLVFPLIEIARDHLQDAIIPAALALTNAFLLGGVIPALLGLAGLLPAFLAGTALVLDPFAGNGLITWLVRELRDLIVAFGLILARPVLGLQLLPWITDLMVADLLVTLVKDVDVLVVALSLISSKLLGVSVLGGLLLAIPALLAPLAGLVALIWNAVTGLVLVLLDLVLPIPLITYFGKAIFDFAVVKLLFDMWKINFALRGIELLVALTSIGAVPALLFGVFDLLMAILDGGWDLLTISPIRSLVPETRGLINLSLAGLNWTLAVMSVVNALLILDAAALALLY